MSSRSLARRGTALAVDVVELLELGSGDGRRGVRGARFPFEAQATNERRVRVERAASERALQLARLGLVARRSCRRQRLLIGRNPIAVQDVLVEGVA